MTFWWLIVIVTFFLGGSGSGLSVASGNGAA